ncbi:TIGR01777 family oxidoreductase [Flavobacterium rhizosphaerae]|uniref:TIGR01777 family oxidoreductase n=1 Tax=Flavobacterium rhizosphaerae TaxID=3163298 RepID=A0ABW8YTW9_9FLAO
MKVLITGATGLVGNELVSLLLKNGIYINYLTTSKEKLQSEDNYKGYLWNPHRGEIDTNCIDGVDVIVHLAGASISKRWTKSYKEEIVESRVLSANIIYNLLKNNSHTVKQFISASAIGIYPDSLDNVYSENSTERDHSFLCTVVEKWEEAAMQIERLNIPVAIVRTGLVLSASGGMLKEIAMPVKFGVGTAFGSGKQMQSWIHLRDLVGIYYYIIKNNLEGIYNAVAPYPVTQNTLMKTVTKVLDKPYFMPNIPKFAIEMVMGQAHVLVLASQNVSARKILGQGYQFKYLSLEKAIKAELK